MKIFSKFTPNLYLSQAFTSFMAHFQSQSQSDTNASKAQSKLARKLGVLKSQVTLTYGARAALYAYLSEQKKQHPKKTEVIISAYTCRVLINPILKLGLTPVFIDLDKESLRMSVEQINSKISAKTLAIIIQHTFGAMEDIQTLKKIHKNIPLIADNAHFLPNHEEIRQQAKLYNAAIFSFGTNKILSASNLGALVVYKSKNKLEYISQLQELPKKIVHKQLFKNWWFTICMKFYSFLSCGKVLMFIAAKCKFIEPVVSTAEKKLKSTNVNYYKAPSHLAITLLHALKFYQKQITHRVLIKSIYQANLNSDLQFDKYFFKAQIFFPIKVKKPKKIAKFLESKSYQVNLDWTSDILVPYSKSIPSNFKIKDFPNAAKVAKHLVLLPLNKTISPTQAVELCDLINQHES